MLFLKRECWKLWERTNWMDVLVTFKFVYGNYLPKFVNLFPRFHSAATQRARAADKISGTRVNINNIQRFIRIRLTIV